MRLHVTVSDEVGDAVLAVAQSERRPVSNAAAILLDEAIAARKRKATRAELRAVKQRRDELMRENAELKKDLKFWKKKAGAK